jgi:hypothetical protein
MAEYGSSDEKNKFTIDLLASNYRNEYIDGNPSPVIDEVEYFFAFISN